MDKRQLIQSVRSYARDFNGTIFREEDISLFLNEGIDRIKQVLPMLNNMPYLFNDEDFPGHIPIEYHHLLSVYAVARLFSQDERHYESATYMNEFEVKLDEFVSKVENGDVLLLDPETGEDLFANNHNVDYVVDNYFLPNVNQRWGDE
jgi:hypothetical protein